ncbi:MAG: hypothetical protein EOO05_07100 [Chitinophagaceae bacterium]|nr:MAG: hypothetical protein EOO05_07100 [Chitinophagaceae bacterium]
MKLIAFSIASLLGIMGVLVFSRDQHAVNDQPPEPISAALKLKAGEARSFVEGKNYNDQVVFLLDFRISSSRARFFVYDLKKDSVLNSGLVTHGRCNQEWLEGRQYGNTVGCGCSSLGKFRIGKKYKGMFGQAYKLHGLETTNDKAFDRFVVLHSHECVPESAGQQEICQSDGCPTVSPNFLKYLQPIIDRSDKPVMLWIFEG